MPSVLFSRPLPTSQTGPRRKSPTDIARNVHEFWYDLRRGVASIRMLTDSDLRTQRQSGVVGRVLWVDEWCIGLFPNLGVEIDS